MARNEDKQMTLAEVMEMTPGDNENPCWLNGTITCGITGISHEKTKNNMPYTRFELFDPDNSSMRMRCTLFGAWPRTITDGCIVQVGGSGNRLTEYNGNPQITFGKNGALNKLGDWTPAKTAPKPTGAFQASGTTQRSPQPAQTHSGVPTLVQIAPQDGQAVGASLKMAHDTIIAEVNAGQREKTFFETPDYQSTLLNRASDILRLGNLMKSGKIAPPFKDRVFEAAAAPEPEPEPDPEIPQPGDDSGAAFPRDEDFDQEVPF